MANTRASAAHTAVLEERARIARELHDSVSQTLYAITLTASRALELLNHSDPKQLQQLLGDVLRHADTGQSDLRSLLANIRSDLLMSGGVTAGLARLAADLRTGRDLEIGLSLGNEPDVPAATKEALLLISREALHNVVRHGGADRVDIVLEADAQRLVLLITDNGRGFDPAMQRPGHFGLQSMRERATAVGGVLTLVSAEGVGTQVRVCVPRATRTSMDEFERLVSVYRTRASASAKSRLDVLMDIEQLRDAGVVSFLLEVLGDRGEREEVRMHVVKRLRNRNGCLTAADRPLAAKAVGEVLADRSNVQLRLQAALTLGHLTDIPGVLSTLSAASLARDESIDLRYAAFTSIERAGPTPESIALMRQIARDEALGGAARSVLSAWHVA